MKLRQTIVHIGGGEAFNSREQYVHYLKTRTMWHMQESTGLPWFKNYGEFLNQDDYYVIYVPMPCRENAQYADWSLWFERHIEYFHANTIFIGHSLGGIFLAKYLSENVMLDPIKQLHLVAPPYEDENNLEQLADFKIINFPYNLSKNTIGEIHIYHSVDDTIVSISESEKYVDALPEARFHRFEDRGHFLEETFPELFDAIKNG